jgi:hypothetical protein
MNEHQRHVKARESILKGETPEKRIFVHMEDLEEKKKRQDEVKADRDRRNDKMDALKEAKIPWFCPECDKVMKSRLDDKMYRLHTHCFDCQVKFENKLRVEGKYDEWEEKRVLNNKLSYVKDQIESIKDWKSQSFEVYNQVGVKDVELEKEKWNVNRKKIETKANEAIEEFEDIKADLEKVINN